MTEAVKPRTRRKEARPAEMLEAALATFVEKGYAATRLEEIATRAGVSKGTIYLYFDSKEALFTAVIREGMLPILANAEDLAATHEGPAADLLRTLIHDWWQRIGSTRLGAVHKLMMSEAGNFPDVSRYYHETFVTRGRALIRRVLTLGIERSEFRPVDIEAAIDVIFAPMLMLAVWSNSIGPCVEDMSDPDRFIETHLDLLLCGGLVSPRKPCP